MTIKFISSDFTYGNSLHQNSPQSLSLDMNPSNFANFDNVTKVELMKGFDNVEFNLKSIPHKFQVTVFHLPKFLVDR